MKYAFCLVPRDGYQGVVEIVKARAEAEMYQKILKLLKLADKLDDELRVIWQDDVLDETYERRVAIAISDYRTQRQEFLDSL